MSLGFSKYCVLFGEGKRSDKHTEHNILPRLLNVSNSRGVQGSKKLLHGGSAALLVIGR